MTTQPPPCTECGNPRRHRQGGHGWCVACYHRWYRAGAIEGEPPPPPRNGPEYSAALREEVRWLVQGGESVEQAADRVGITVDTARDYTRQPTPTAGCAALDCTQDATHGRHCQAHRDYRAAYAQARAAGLDRKAAAARAGIRWRSTYLWEPGRPGVGRPRKRAVA